MDEFGRQALEARENPERLNRFLAENKKFILSAAYRAVNRFVTDSDDEYSIALIAFSEAVETYDETKGAFGSFTSLVIKRRLIDYIRSEARHAPEIPLEPSAMDADLAEFDEPNGFQQEVLRRTAEWSENSPAGQSFRPESNPVRDEIEAVTQLLAPYGFSFLDLADASPRADKTKRACAEVVAALLKSPELFSQMRKNRSLPAKELKRLTKANDKLLERHRKYIIAAAEILNGEYPLLAEYMSYIRESLKT